jgi:hypothetical protein
MDEHALPRYKIPANWTDANSRKTKLSREDTI